MEIKSLAEVVQKKVDDIFCMDNVSQGKLSRLGKNISCGVTIQQVKILQTLKGMSEVNMNRTCHDIFAILSCLLLVKMSRLGYNAATKSNVLGLD